MPVDRAELAADYYFIITPPGPSSKSWGWQIHRRSKPLDLKAFRTNFKSATDAKLAGEKALSDLLDRIAQKPKAQLGSARIYWGK